MCVCPHAARIYDRSRACLQNANIAIWVTPSNQGLTPVVTVPTSPQQLFILGPGNCAAPAATPADTLVVTAPQSDSAAAAAAGVQQAERDWACGACGLDEGAAVVLPLEVTFPAGADSVGFLR